MLSCDCDVDVKERERERARLDSIEKPCIEKEKMAATCLKMAEWSFVCVGAGHCSEQE
jgi:hypothetical protein